MLFYSIRKCFFGASRRNRNWLNRGIAFFWRRPLALGAETRAKAVY